MNYENIYINTFQSLKIPYSLFIKILSILIQTCLTFFV